MFQNRIDINKARISFSDVQLLSSWFSQPVALISQICSTKKKVCKKKKERFQPLEWTEEEGLPGALCSLFYRGVKTKGSSTARVETSEIQRNRITAKGKLIKKKKLTIGKLQNSVQNCFSNTNVPASPGRGFPAAPSAALALQHRCSSPFKLCIVS